jgi:hypothetical protein
MSPGSETWSWRVIELPTYAEKGGIVILESVSWSYEMVSVDGRVIEGDPESYVH